MDVQMIGFIKLFDKLVFESARYKLPVIANQRARWCGNPPVRGEMYRKAPGKTGIVAVFGGNHYLVPFNRGIATPVCALARNDSVFFGKHRFVVLMK